MMLQWAGPVMAAVTVVTIWAGHVMVRKVNYRFGTAPVPLVALLGLGAIAASLVVSAPEEISFSLRMSSIVSGYYECSIAASTGIHDAEAAIKHFMAGTDVVQLCSALYKNGFKHARRVIDDINEWLDDHRIASLDEIRGKLSRKNSPHQADYERAQYIKAFGNIK